jgi:hypothetical protein
MPFFSDPRRRLCALMMHGADPPAIWVPIFVN